MKGILILELFGEDTRQLFKLYRMAFEVGGGDFGRMYFDKYIGGIPPRSSWVAEITGPDEKYGLKREFVRCKINYSHSNSKGSRGIFAEYILSEGRIYEVKTQVTWKRADRYFCTVSKDGDIVELDEEAVCHGMGAITRDERAERRSVKIAEITGPDEQYFFARKFLPCSMEYSAVAEKVPYPGYILQAGKIYEVREIGRRGKETRYYCTIDENGTIVKMDEDDACRAVGTLTREERWEKKRAERISRY